MFEDIVDKVVHDVHGLKGCTRIGVDLFQDIVDVDGVRFLLFISTSLLEVLLGLLSNYRTKYILEYDDDKLVMDDAQVCIFEKTNRISF